MAAFSLSGSSLLQSESTMARPGRLRSDVDLQPSSKGFRIVEVGLCRELLKGSQRVGRICAELKGLATYID